jgi:hypothetical protein
VTFFIFPKLKNVVKERHFGRHESLTDILKTIPVEDFQRCYQKLEKLLYRCVAALGNYFERITVMFEKI